MTKLSSVVRHADRLLSEPRPLGSGTGSITHDRFLTNKLHEAFLGSKTRYLGFLNPPSQYRNCRVNTISS